MIFFLHVPRSMGTALKDQCLYPNWAHAEVVLDFNWQHCSSVPGNVHTAQLVCGHVSYSAKDLLTNPQIITMIRHPIYRAKSMFNFVKRVKWHYLHEESQNMSLVDFCKHPQGRPMVNNAYARYLTCDTEARIIQTDQRFFALPVPGEEELLEKAKRRLDQMMFVGVADRFYESVMLLWSRLGFTEPKMGRDMARQMHPMLRSNIYPIFTPEYEILMDLNCVDLKLFEYANELLDWRLGL